MINALAHLLPLAMLLPAIPADEARPVQGEQAGLNETAALQQRQSETVAKPKPVPQQGNAQDAWLPLSEDFRPKPRMQVRIERRVIIRVTARRPTRTSPVSGTPSTNSSRPVYREKKMGKCVKAKNIAWMQPDQSRLIFVMNDRKFVSARLNKKCRARDFYSGFYVERHKDGRICVKRDELQSRAGSKCRLRSLHELVPVGT